MASALRLTKRWEQLMSAASQVRTTAQDIADFLIPHKSNILTQRQEGARQTDKLFDSTGPHALLLLASSLHGTMTPATQPWLSLRMRQEELNEDKEVEDWLEDTARRIHKALRQSTFNQSVHELYLDLAAFGTAAKLIEERPPEAGGAFAGFRFIVPAFGTYCIAENYDGQVDTLFREIKLSYRTAAKQWEKTFPEDLKQRAANKPDDMLEVIHAIYPRDDVKYDDQGRAKRGVRNMPWASCYFLPSHKTLLEEGGYEEFPACVPRWNKTSGEVYGRGPSHTALPDVASLNAFKEFFLKVAPMGIQPPTIERSDSVVGELDTRPGGRNYIDAQGPLGDSIGFLEPRMRPDMTNITFAELRQAIHSYYFTDQLILAQKPNMTATEVLALQEQMHRLLGPTTGRLESEFLNPLVQRCFAIMARANAFLPLPNVLRESAAQGVADLDIEYEGPLARAQRTVELAAQDRTVALVAMIAQAKAQFPGLEWDILDTDKFIRDRAEITGLRSDSLRAQQDVERMRQTRQQKQAEDEQAQKAMQIGEMAKNVTPMLQAMQAKNGGGEE